VSIRVHPWLYFRLNELFTELRAVLAEHGRHYGQASLYRDFRAGDARHSLADIGKAQQLLGYGPQLNLHAGIEAAMPWYLPFLKG